MSGDSPRVFPSMSSSGKSCTRVTSRRSAASRSWPGRCGRSPWPITRATGCGTRCTSARAWCPRRSRRWTTRRPGAPSSARRSSACRRPAGRSTGWPARTSTSARSTWTRQWQVQARAARFGQYVSPVLADFDSYWAMRAGELQSAYDHFDHLDLSAMSLRRAVDGAQGRVRVPPPGLVHPLRGHVRADRQLPGLLRPRRGDRAVRVAGVVVPCRAADVLLADRRGAVAAGRAGAQPRHRRRAAERVARRTCGQDRRAAARRRPGSRSSTSSSPSTGSGSRRPAGSTSRPGPRTRPPRCTRSARSCPSRPGSTSTRRGRPPSPSGTRRSRRRGGAVNGADLARFNAALASNQAANFAWWNEEHNYLIDRRAAIPVRRATLELGARLAAAGAIADPTDLFYLFKPELFERDGAGRRRPGGVGGAAGDGPRPARLLRVLAGTRAVAADRCSARSPRWCPTRS